MSRITVTYELDDVVALAEVQLPEGMRLVSAVDFPGLLAAVGKVLREEFRKDGQRVGRIR